VLVHRAIPTDPAVRSSRSLFLAESSEQSGAPSRKLLFSGLSPAPPVVAGRMGVAPETGLLTRRRLMLVNEVPIRLATSYFLPEAPESAELSVDSFLGAGLQDLFDRHGRTFGRAEETLVARKPSAEEAELLAIAAGDPVVEIVRTSFDAAGEPVHTLQTICAAGRHVFDVRQLDRDEVF
jgi:DNA-binding GntR family transcriptional regulator